MSQQTGLSRGKKTLDKYYTNPKYVNSCITKFTETVEINKDMDLVIEPSAGDGAFIPSLESICDNRIYLDIHPENDKVSKIDYLEEFNPSMVNLIDIDNNEFNEKGEIINESNKVEKVHVIGNPPFGKQSSLAIKFIKKSAKYADTIAFILPRSFKKQSMIKHFPLNFHLVFQEDVPEDSFLVNGKPHNVPCVYQIWEKREINRQVEAKQIPQKFKFVKQNEDPDISFRRVGVYAGNVSLETENKSSTSHYFIKLVDIPITAEIVEKLNKIKYDKSEDTVGAKSISKQELIKEFNMIL